VAVLSTHYRKIADAEQVAIEDEALAAIARAADGSVRDGLSLLDQAIAQGFVADEQMVSASSVAEMLGVADRGMVFDLMEAGTEGRPADALAITDQVYALGADLGVLLGDLLDLTHTLSRLKSVPELRRSQELPEAERVRGAALADRLTIPVLARAWQMLLKGMSEVESAPDRRAAAEMILIRLCHVSDQSPPGDLVKRLLAQGAPTNSTSLGSVGPRPDGGGGRATSGALALAQPAELAPVARVASFRDVLALALSERDPLLHGYLLHSIHLVRFAPPIIELRPQADAPRDLASKLGALLLRTTGTRWTIAISAASGDATLGEQSSAAERDRRSVAAEHPLVRAIMEAFPGARIETVRDPGVDLYGLPTEISLGEPGTPGFTADDPDEPADLMDAPLEADPRFLTETQR
jgi:DNA polymerase-3 subunit gamma/tau